MAKISQKMRERILAERKNLETGSGVVISNKDITKIRVRILPPKKDELPGTRFISYYAESLRTEKKGTASPESFGRPCPIAAAMDMVNRSASTKEERQEARDFCSTTTEYWIPVIVRSEEQTVEQPNIRVLAAKKTVYQEILRLMEDDDIGEDITDPDEGCDLLIKKTGAGRETKWTVAKLESTPLHEDEDVQAALIDAAEEFDTSSHFYPVNEEVLEKIYESLTGKSMPDKFRESDRKSRKRDDDDAEDDAPKARSRKRDDDDAEDDAPKARKAKAKEEPEIEPGATVTFDNEGDDLEGEVISIDGKMAVVKVGDEEWDVKVANLTLVETEDEDAPEDEPEETEEVEPATTRRARRPKEDDDDEKPAKAKPAKAEKPAKAKASDRIRARGRR